MTAQLQRSLIHAKALLGNFALTKLPERVTVAAQPISTPELEEDIAAAGSFPVGFRSWLKHWHFKNRESGADHTFAQLWPGQDTFADLMASARCDYCHHAWRYVEPAEDCPRCGNPSAPLWLFALKAGKLGFTELECAWDGYVAWARRNGRVHLFSKEEKAAKTMLGYVRYGLRNLEPAWGVRFISIQEREIPAERSAQQLLRFIVVRPGGQRDLLDIREIEAFATAKDPAIDKTAHHAHVDEWAHMEHPKDVWSSVGTTVAPDGSAHIVTRGNGENEDVEAQWKEAVDGSGKIRSFFAPWTQRPDRDRAWLEAEARTLRTTAAISHYAPESPEDAFIGDEDNDFVPIEWWDACFDASLARFVAAADGRQELAGERGWWRGNMAPGDRTPMVLSLDAGVSHDNFAATGWTRHPERQQDPALRLVSNWKPDDFEDGRICIFTAESWVRAVCQGGCPLGHPMDPEWKYGRKNAKRVGQAWEPGHCPACLAIDEATAAGASAQQLQERGLFVPAFNVAQIVYDPWQLEQMAQGLKRDAVAWVYAMPQGQERKEADRNFYDMILSRRLAHPGDWRVREHVGNAKQKTSKDEDSKMSMIKKAPHRRIDLGVSGSMGCKRCLYLMLETA